MDMMSNEDSMRQKYAQSFVLLFLHFIEYYHPKTRAIKGKSWDTFSLSAFMLFGELVSQILSGQRSEIDWTINQKNCEPEDGAKEYVKFEFFSKCGQFVCCFRTTNQIGGTLFLNGLREVQEERGDEFKALMANLGYFDLGFQIPLLIKNIQISTVADGIVFTNIPKVEDFYKKIVSLMIKE